MKVRPLPAWTNGLGRVLRAPALVLVLWICSLAITIPPAIALNDAIGRHLGSSMEADAALDGTNYDWLQEFRAQASSLGRSLRTDVIGFAAVRWSRREDERPAEAKEPVDPALDERLDDELRNLD